MPGGKVVVLYRILPVTKDATGLAVVMGHEIAHAIANHGGERMSQGLFSRWAESRSKRRSKINQTRLKILLLDRFWHRYPGWCFASI
jgi:hypothetical protein